MATMTENISEKNLKILEKKKVLKSISDWVLKNKKVFWKYEVTSFYKSYVMKISNLPDPSVDDIYLSSYNKLLTEPVKKQLCVVMKKVFTGIKNYNDSSISVQIDYKDDVIVSEV